MTAPTRPHFHPEQYRAALWLAGHADSPESLRDALEALGMTEYAGYDTERGRTIPRTRRVEKHDREIVLGKAAPKVVGAK